MTKAQRDKLISVVTEWAKNAQDFDCIRFQNGEVIIDNRGCEIFREYIY